MKIAIDHKKRGFAERWIEYCKQNNINYILVDVYKTNIIDKIVDEGVTHFMWHINHASSTDLMLYPYLMNSLDTRGIKTFPNFNTRWHFDDKVAQKYLLESINAPLVPSYVFYSEAEDLSHLKTISFPIVTKLKRGAGATNVKLLKSFEEAEEYVKTMFSTGINPNAGALGNLDQKLRIAKQIKSPIHLIKKTYGFLVKNRREQKISNNERGYFYFQKFMPGNDYDTRVIVVGEKAIAIRRNNREGDFRASGSGIIEYDYNLFDTEMIKIAFEVSKQIKGQSLAFDFVYDMNKQAKIIEICFGFSKKAYDKCNSYWNSDLEIVHERVNLQYEMMRSFLYS